MNQLTPAEILRKLKARSNPPDFPCGYTGVDLAKYLACHFKDPFCQEFQRGVAVRIKRLYDARVEVQAAVLATELNLVRAMKDEMRLFDAHHVLWGILNEIDSHDKPELVRGEDGKMPVSDPLCYQVEDRLAKLEKIRFFASRVFGFIEKDKPDSN